MVVGVVVWLMLTRSLLCCFGITSRVLVSGLYLTLSRRILTEKGDREHPLNYRPTSCMPPPAQQLRNVSLWLKIFKIYIVFCNGI